MLVTTSPEGFNEWGPLAQLLHEAFRYMEGRIDPPSSLESMGIEAFKKKAQDEILIVAHDDPGTEFSSPQPNAFDSLIRQATEAIRPVHFQNSPQNAAALPAS